MRRAVLNSVSAQSADTDKSGYVDKEELELVLREQLLINLSDPEEDMQIIFSLLDRDDSGLISVKEFRAAFEPGIAKRSLTQTGTMDVDDLMKDTFQAFISESRHERGIVIRAFMEAHNEIEESGRGFGKNYWSPASSP